MMPTDRVSQFLQDLRLLDPDRHELVQTLRAMVLGLSPAVTEEIKYGGILFSAGQPFCGVFSYAKPVSLEFGAGAALPDEYRVLEGAGKLRRHIKMSCSSDIAAKHVAEYLALALMATVAS
jgi:hypothetical protein